MILSGPIVHYESTESTQNEAKRILSGVHWTTNQTAGKGRFNRKWYSEPGRSLAVSIAFPEYQGSAKPHLISIWICLALAEEFDLRVQWPNDLVLNHKKVCGVLTEVIEGIPIVGFGMNVGLMSFPDELKPRASSLRNEGLRVGTPVEVLERIIRKIHELEGVPSQWGGLDEKWRKFDETLGKLFRLQDGRTGIADGVSEDGELIWNDRGDYEIVTCADALWGAESLDMIRQI